jgi:hypothetical protein
MATQQSVLIIVLMGWGAWGQTLPNSVLDTRLTVHTLVREDVFAGFMANDRELLARGERTLQRLLLERPQDKADIVAWQGWASLARAVLAHEANEDAESAELYQRAKMDYAEATRLTPNSETVAIIIGGSYAALADRLPSEYRRAAWDEAYVKYRKVWENEGPAIDSLPLHIKGELLSGLAQTAQRTGRDAEELADLNLIIEKMPGTPYAARAETWKRAPQIASRTAIICQTCHEPRRLAALTAELKK